MRRPSDAFDQTEVRLNPSEHSECAWLGFEKCLDRVHFRGLKEGWMKSPRVLIACVAAVAVGWQAGTASVESRLVSPAADARQGDAASQLAPSQPVRIEP